MEETFNPVRETTAPPEGMAALYEKTDRKADDGKEIYALKANVAYALSGGDLAKENIELKKAIKGRQMEIPLDKAAAPAKLPPPQGLDDDGAIFPVRVKSATQPAAPPKPAASKPPEPAPAPPAPAPDDAAARQAQKLADALRVRLEEQDKAMKSLQAETRLKEERSVIERAITAKGGSPEILLSHVERNIVFKDGKAFKKDAQGDPALLPGSSQYQTLGEFVDELKKDKTWGVAFKTPASSVGTNFQPISGASMAPPDSKGHDPSLSINKRMTAKEEVDFLKQHGVEAYSAAMARITRERVGKIRARNARMISSHRFDDDE